MVASEALSVGVVVSFAVRRYSSANSIVGVPEFTAFQADSLVPVPLGTSDIRNSLSRSQITSSSVSVKVIAFVASQTVSVGTIVGLAEVVDGSTNAVSIEEPEVRASETFLVSPVPFFAASV